MKNCMTGRLPPLGGLPHLPGVPHLHVNRPLLYQSSELPITAVARRDERTDDYHLKAKYLYGI